MNIFENPKIEEHFGQSPAYFVHIMDIFEWTIGSSGYFLVKLFEELDPTSEEHRTLFPGLNVGRMVT